MPVSSETILSLAEKVGGALAGEQVDPKRQILGVNDLKSAQRDQISFLANPKYEPLARSSHAGVILVSDKGAEFPFPQIRVPSPSRAFEQVCAIFAPAPVTFAHGTHPTAVIAPDVILGEGVSIQPHVTIEAGVTIGAGTVIGAGTYVGAESKIGQGTLIYPNVVLRERSIIGNRVIIQPGAIIGSDGFGYEFSQGKHVKIAQIGYVQLDDDVEIGANTTIDRGRFGRTHIGQGTKIDNLVQIAHNVTIGPHCIIVAQTGISGSTTLGKYVTLAGQVGAVGHITIGDKATVTAQSGVSKDVPPGVVVAGHHAIPLRESLKQEALVRRLPELLKRIQELEERLAKS
jgi:UDP-3-O-[3-hydroxymyristoyl] glucosamine N-acyltransferase